MKTFSMKIISSVFFILALFFFNGCSDGGSRGTGGTELRGTLYVDSTRYLSRSYAPLSGITVTVGATGASTVTNEFGYYSIKTDLVGSELELFFDGPNLSTKYITSEIPANTFRATFDFEIDQKANAVEAINIEFETKDEGTDSESNNSTGDNDSSDDNDDGDNDNDSDDDTGDDDKASNGNGDDDNSSGSNGNTSNKKVTICHKPDSKNPTTIKVSEDALAGHLAHGDTMGACPEESGKKSNKKN